MIHFFAFFLIAFTLLRISLIAAFRVGRLVVFGVLGVGFILFL